MSSDSIQLQASFLAHVASGCHFGQLFDELPGVSFFAKNQDFQFIAANRRFWRRFGFQSEAELIGKTDFDLFPEQLARNYRADDEDILSSGEPKRKIVEPFFNQQGLPDWFFTHKLPIRSVSGAVIGIMGIIETYAAASAVKTPYFQLDRAVNHIREHFRETIAVTDLAKLAGLSVRQFNRLFQQVFQSSPRTFLIKTRIQAACQELRRSDLDLTEIAQHSGFCDQSAMTLHFRQHMGTTPARYRRDHRQRASDASDD
ncbi:PAS domain S-box-containing protein [Prosthecobacter debontii]|uniref:PAS domain S-box-containing protein n=1 Tax=Prosthecobacter debontii TaxID=48467 RepID=A0A1T4WZH3_9BACT|nr:PAS domain S-box-containing protein [Prosthecobacter debontii]